MKNKYSIIFPQNSEYKTLSMTTIHDLGLDLICRQISPKESQQNIIFNVMSKMCDDPKVAKYRFDIFEDIKNNKSLRKDIMEVLDRINFLRDYGGFNREYEEAASVWDLMHRLDEIRDYIKCVDSLFETLSKSKLNSDGLKGLYEYVNNIYKDNGFAELKSDIDKISTETNNIKSITVGINLNNRYEADGIGLISVNSKYFTKSGVISNFCDHISSKDRISDSAGWNKDYRFSPFNVQDAGSSGGKLGQIAETNIAISNPLMAMTGIASIPEKDVGADITRYMDRIVNHMLARMTKNLKEILNKYISITITDMTDLIPEFMYYILWAEYIEKLEEKGARFCKPRIINYTNDINDRNDRSMNARGLYNIKLADFSSENSDELVTNDLDFDAEKRVYILTGANRGGKTTITQAVGQAFVMAQGGIYVAADDFAFCPVDGVYTHFPADEDKTMDLGRLGEECRRFKEIYDKATKNSLILLNETFSTTSFEEGYYIARDSVKALLHKGVKTIYNTHMHKLAFEIDELNKGDTDGKAASLTMLNTGEKRSYKVAVAPPTGKSFASDIASKYGVTYEALILAVNQ